MRVLITYHDKDSGAYKRFEGITLNEKLTLDVLKDHLTGFNKNSEDEYAVIHEEEWLGDLTEDLSRSYSYSQFVERMKDICSEIDDTAREISYQADEIQESLCDDKLEAIREFCKKNQGDPMVTEILSILED